MKIEKNQLLNYHCMHFECFCISNYQAISNSVQKLRMFLVNRLCSLKDNLKFFFASIDDIGGDILINLLDSLLILECKLSK